MSPELYISYDRMLQTDMGVYLCVHIQIHEGVYIQIRNCIYVFPTVFT